MNQLINAVGWMWWEGTLHIVHILFCPFDFSLLLFSFNTKDQVGHWAIDRRQFDSIEQIAFDFLRCGVNKVRSDLFTIYWLKSI